MKRDRLAGFIGRLDFEFPTHVRMYSALLNIIAIKLRMKILRILSFSLSFLAIPFNTNQRN